MYIEHTTPRHPTSLKNKHFKTNNCIGGNAPSRASIETTGKSLYNEQRLYISKKV